MHQELFIKRGDFGTCRTIHKNRIENIHADNLVMQHSGRRRDSFFFHLFPIRSKVNARTCEECTVPVGNAHHLQLQAAFLHQLLLLATDLFYQAAAHRTGTTDKQVQYLILRQEE